MGGMTRLLLLLWAGVTVGSLVDLQKRIIGGHDCAADEHPYHVIIKINGKPSCSGSVISDRWILTAAHCYEDGWTLKVVFRNAQGETISRKNIIKHEDGDDIMLLKLSNPTKITAGPLPTLADCKKPDIGEEVQIAGYKSTAGPGDVKRKKKLDLIAPLQCATIKVVDCGGRTCESKYKYPHVFCYHDKAKKVDTTPGDSGGGVEYEHKIYGVHVRGKKKGCAGPAKAMDVCYYMPWIGSIVFDREKKCGVCAGALKKFCEKYFKCD